MRYINDGTARGKAFDEELYRKTDAKAGEAFMKNVKKWYAVKRVEDYKIDAEIYYDEEDYKKGCSPLCTVELEINMSKYWTKGKPNFAAGLVFERKTKNFKALQTPIHVQFNHSCDDCFIVSYSELIKMRVYDREFKTGKDIIYLVPLQALTFGIENIEKFIFDFVCDVIKRQDYKEVGYLNTDKKTTKKIFELANHVHRVMHVQQGFREEPLQLKHQEKVKHKFYRCLVEATSKYNRLMVYYDKQAFLNKEEPLCHFVIDRDEKNGWVKGESLGWFVWILRQKLIYFQTEYIPFHIQINIAGDDCYIANVGSILQSFMYDKNLVKGQVGYVRLNPYVLMQGEENIEQFIFEHICEITGNYKLINQGLDNTSKADVVKLFRLINHIYRVNYGLNKSLNSSLYSA